jgi:hypothetical protein
MKYEQWAVEPFIRDFDTRINKEVNPDILDTEITRIIHNYLSFRNIQQSETQKAEMIAIILHEIINFPFLKSYTIRWALNEFTDLTNQNVSAAVLIGMIKKGYSHEKHKEVLKLWELADQKKPSSRTNRGPKRGFKRQSQGRLMGGLRGPGGE